MTDALLYSLSEIIAIAIAIAIDLVKASANVNVSVILNVIGYWNCYCDSLALWEQKL
jgi:hypothetical protein